MEENKSFKRMQMPSHISGSAPLPLVLVLILSSALLQAGIRTVAEESAVAQGTWSGEHVILEVSKSGAEVEFDCAHGQITQAITLDKHGDFDVVGTFTPEHGGPIRRDENTPSASARYSGHVTGDAINLTVTVAEERVGPYTLTRGAHAMLTKCR
jgi:hypothetical protein